MGKVQTYHGKIMLHYSCFLLTHTQKFLFFCYTGGTDLCSAEYCYHQRKPQASVWVLLMMCAVSVSVDKRI